MKHLKIYFVILILIFLSGCSSSNSQANFEKAILYILVLFLTFFVIALNNRIRDLYQILKKEQERNTGKFKKIEQNQHIHKQKLSKYSSESQKEFKDLNLKISGVEIDTNWLFEAIENMERWYSGIQKSKKIKFSNPLKENFAKLDNSEKKLAENSMAWLEKIYDELGGHGYIPSNKFKDKSGKAKNFDVLLELARRTYPTKIKFEKDNRGRLLIKIIRG